MKSGKHSALILLNIFFYFSYLSLHSPSSLPRPSLPAEGCDGAPCCSSRICTFCFSQTAHITVNCGFIYPFWVTISFLAWSWAHTHTHTHTHTFIYIHMHIYIQKTVEGILPVQVAKRHLLNCDLILWFHMFREWITVKMWYICTIEYNSAMKENEIISSCNMDATRDYHTKWSKSKRDRQIAYGIT